MVHCEGENDKTKRGEEINNVTAKMFLFDVGIEEQEWDRRDLFITVVHFAVCRI